MSDIVLNFSRTEKKYLLKSQEYEALFHLISDKIKPDKFGDTAVSSLYFDTPDFRLIRNSVYHEGFKEKLRLRAYGHVTENTPLFFEIKRKIKGVVYKRRIALRREAAEKYFSHGILPEDSQIMREIDYAYNFYGRPAPKIKISCQRQSFVLKENENVRITIDREVLYDFENTDLCVKSGKPLFEKGYRLMEIKTPAAIPLWLGEALNNNKIFPRSFSKYGKAWEKEKGEKVL